MVEQWISRIKAMATILIGTKHRYNDVACSEMRHGQKYLMSTKYNGENIVLMPSKV